MPSAKNKSLSTFGLLLVTLCSCAHANGFYTNPPGGQGVYKCDPATGEALHGLRAYGMGPRPPGSTTRQGLRPGTVYAVLPSRGTVSQGSKGFGPCDESKDKAPAGGPPAQR